MTPESIAVFGLGAWGSALAKLLVRNGHSVRLWGSSSGQRARLQRDWTGEKAHRAVSVEDDLGVLMAQASHFLIAVPSRSFRATLSALRPAKHATMVWATKGFEAGSGKLLSEVMDEEHGPYRLSAAVSGPTFASEIARDLPASLTVASRHDATASMVAGWFRNDRLLVHTSRDVAGVQIGGATKNVMAVVTGISDGLGFGANARAALITRGLEEITRLGVAMGARTETFQGFAGIGDLVLTCTDDSSRNRRVGLGLGRGGKLSDVLAQIGQETEGVAAAREIYHLARRFKIEMPVVEQVYRVLYEDKPPQAAIKALFRGEPAQREPMGRQVLPLRARLAAQGM
ncbi:MAG: NAD(P)H-dependent glycerol-3-phosphate dehydrogenase [Burkholderiales bacterium]